MVIKTTVVSIFTFGYNAFRYSVDAVVYVVTVVINLSLIMLNAALSFLVLFEEIAVVILLLPWIPAKRIGSLFQMLKNWGFPHTLTLTLYILMSLTFVVLNILSLEMHYLGLNKNLVENFDEFKNSLFSSMKLFIIIHRLIHLLSNESLLKNTCYLLKKRLKIEQGEEVDEKSLGLPNDEDLKISDLKGELERTRLDLEAMREAYDRLQHKMKQMDPGGTSLSSYKDQYQ